MLYYHTPQLLRYWRRKVMHKFKYLSLSLSVCPAIIITTAISMAALLKWHLNAFNYDMLYIPSQVVLQLVKSMITLYPSIHAKLSNKLMTITMIITYYFPYFQKGSNDSVILQMDIWYVFPKIWKICVPLEFGKSYAPTSFLFAVPHYIMIALVTYILKYIITLRTTFLWFSPLTVCYMCWEND